MSENPPFRFVHTADLHLDSPLESLALRSRALRDQVAGATRAALRGIVALCIEESVDALLIAGDLYDGAQKSMHTAAALTAEMRRLADAGIPVYMIRGNHDAESRITEELMLPDNVHVFGGRGGVETLRDGAVAIHGVSFRGKHAPESLLPKLKMPIPDAINIGMLHTSLAGSDGRHTAYAPCTLGELVDHGYDYWALGHVHKRSVHHEGPAVVMPGNPQGRDIGEDGARSVSLVSIDSGGVHIEAREVATTRFERVAVSLAGLESFSHVPDAVETALRALRTGLDTEHLITRIELGGATPLAWRLMRDADLLLETAREIAQGFECVWIEKIESSARLPSVETGADGDPGDSLPELATLIENEALGSTALLERLDQDATALLRKLPAEVRDLLGNDETTRHARLASLAREGSDRLLAALRGGD